VDDDVTAKLLRSRFDGNNIEAEEAAMPGQTPKSGSPEDGKMANGEGENVTGEPQDMEQEETGLMEAYVG